MPIWLYLPATCFNSRTREGCDHPSHDDEDDAVRFQFTHPGGVRLRVYVPLLLACWRFNSRTREGCDAYVVAYVFWLACFNSRTREGCDAIGEHEAKVLV